MARVKNSQPEKVSKPLGVADGFDFDAEDYEDTPSIEVKEPPKKTAKIKKEPSKKPTPTAAGERTYSKYYTPQPKLGKKGGVIGHPPVNEEDRKIQFSVSCTQRQKEQYQEAARKDGRKLPDFVNRAIQEYIENHGLE